MKTKIKIYQVDTFTSKLFSGNPAAVCFLDNWLPDQILQSIALENNLSETAFFIKKKINFFSDGLRLKLKQVYVVMLHLQQQRLYILK